jgi:hypothetical protein
VDKGAELDALAKMPTDDRMLLIGRAAAGEERHVLWPSISKAEEEPMTFPAFVR